MSVSDDAKRFYRIAERELQAIELMKDQSDFSDNIFGFHAQQAVEKLLKAWLWALRIQPPFTHDLNVLIDLLDESTDHVSNEIRLLANLTPYAVQFRYADEEISYPEGRPETVRQIFTLAHKLRDLFPSIDRFDGFH